MALIEVSVGTPSTILPLKLNAVATDELLIALELAARLEELLFKELDRLAIDELALLDGLLMVLELTAILAKLELVARLLFAALDTLELDTLELAADELALLDKLFMGLELAAILLRLELVARLDELLFAALEAPGTELHKVPVTDGFSAVAPAFVP